MKLRCMAASGGQGAGNSIKQGVFKDKTSKKLVELTSKLFHFSKLCASPSLFTPTFQYFYRIQGRKSYFVREKKLSGEKKLMCQIKLFIEKKLSSVVIFLAVEITQVIDSIPWVRCASSNVFKRRVASHQNIYF